jgi:hypothetical protein
VHRNPSCGLINTATSLDAGVLAAWWSLGFIVALIPTNTLTQIPGGAGAIHLDLHTLGVVLLISVGTGVLFG